MDRYTFTYTVNGSPATPATGIISATNTFAVIPVVIFLTMSPTCIPIVENNAALSTNLLDEDKKEEIIKSGAKKVQNILDKILSKFNDEFNFEVLTTSFDKNRFDLSFNFLTTFIDCQYKYIIINSFSA